MKRLVGVFSLILVLYAVFSVASLNAPVTQSWDFDVVMDMLEPLTGRVDGISLPNTILLRSDIRPESDDGRQVIAHEQRHQVQMERRGLIMFCLTYASQYVCCGYDNMALGTGGWVKQAKRDFGGARRGTGK